jgi:hypothetical protein
LIIQTSKLSFHVMTRGPSSVSSPDINMRVRGGHLDRSLPDLERWTPKLSISGDDRRFQNRLNEGSALISIDFSGGAQRAYF